MALTLPGVIFYCSIPREGVLLLLSFLSVLIEFFLIPAQEPLDAFPAIAD
jgi:hypothetical protein